MKPNRKKGILAGALALVLAAVCVRCRLER